MKTKRQRSPLRRQAFAFLGYLGCGISGLLVFIGQPSKSLVEQGGRTFTLIWSGLYVLGALLAVIGLTLDRIFIEIIGAGVSALVSLLWSASLILQAMATTSTVPLTAAFVATSLAGLLAQRWIDASHGFDR